MARMNADEFQDGNLYNGYDYDLQCWVKKGIIQDCGHPDFMRCECMARKHAGEPIEYTQAQLGLKGESNGSRDNQGEPTRTGKIQRD